MGRKKKNVEQNKISLNEYLSKFHRQRILDNVIRKWYFGIDSSNPKRTKDDWDKIIDSFRNETER